MLTRHSHIPTFTSTNATSRYINIRRETSGKPLRYDYFVDIYLVDFLLKGSLRMEKLWVRSVTRGPSMATTDFTTQPLKLVDGRELRRYAIINQW